MKRGLLRLLVTCAIATTSAACEREARPFGVLGRDDRPAGSAPQGETIQADRPGAAGRSPFQDNAWGLAEGKRLFTFYNCVGCHSNGGGGMGPALMDTEWRYGHRPEDIHQSIAKGRPNGMPAFGDRVPDAQIWMLVGYVQAMTGQAPATAMPGRNDHMRATTPENSRRAQLPEGAR